MPRKKGEAKKAPAKKAEAKTPVNKLTPADFARIKKIQQNKAAKQAKESASKKLDGKTLSKIIARNKAKAKAEFIKENAVTKTGKPMKEGTKAYEAKKAELTKQFYAEEKAKAEARKAVKAKDTKAGAKKRDVKLDTPKKTKQNNGPEMG